MYKCILLLLLLLLSLLLFLVVVVVVAAGMIVRYACFSKLATIYVLRAGAWVVVSNLYVN